MQYRVDQSASHKISLAKSAAYSIAGVVTSIAAAVFGSMILTVLGTGLVITGAVFLVKGCRELHRHLHKPTPPRMKQSQVTLPKNKPISPTPVTPSIKKPVSPVTVANNVNHQKPSAPPTDDELIKDAIEKRNWDEAIDCAKMIYDNQERDAAILKIAVSCNSTNPKAWKAFIKNSASEDTKVMVLHAADSQLKTTEVIKLMESNINPERWIKIIAAMIPNQCHKPNSKTIQKHLLITIATAYLNRDNQYATNIDMLNAILDKIEEMLKKDNALEGYLKHFEANPTEALQRFCLTVAWHENPPAGANV